MKPKSEVELKWVGVDLHVHTPASRDYRGGKDNSEYLTILRRANDFGQREKTPTKDKKRDKRNPIGCVVFTDHNSIDGFSKVRELQDETDKLLKILRIRDSTNTLAPQLEDDLAVLRSIRVLMGAEIKANPGIHLLVTFSESTEPSKVVSFLEDAYGAPYNEFSGDPGPTTKWTLKETLDNIQATFLEDVFVTFPHVDSSGGVYEDLKDFAAVRIAALTHPVVKALSFNRDETREKLVRLFNQPDYKRIEPVAYVQSSDFHGAEGSNVGEPRTEVLVREGKASFRNLKEAIKERRVKCSIDFVADEYRDLTEGELVFKFAEQPGGMQFLESDYQRVGESVCAMLNDQGGIIEVECVVGQELPTDAAWKSIREQILLAINERLEPSPIHFMYRTLRIAPQRVKVMVRIARSAHLHTFDGKVFVIRNEKAAVAKASDIESVVSKTIHRRFGSRFEDTLRRTSRNSTLLSKLPRGIPLFFGCQTKLDLGLPEDISIVDLEVPTKTEEIRDLINEISNREDEAHPFGDPSGNATLITENRPPRDKDHYMRLTSPRAYLSEELLAKVSWGKISYPALIVYTGGNISVVEPGDLVVDTPAILIKLEGSWQQTRNALAAWMKSSFFIWYSAVHLGAPSPFFDLQFKPHLIPVPKLSSDKMLKVIEGYAGQIINEEEAFMLEINKHKKRGDLTDEFREKLRRAHNSSAARLSLSIDKEVLTFLDVSIKDQRFISSTLRDLNMTDFGLYDELDPQQKSE